MYEFIYLLQTRESLRNNEDIYKVGRTCKSELERFNNYPKGSILHLHISCVNSCEIENNIINSFNRKFTNVGMYGREYFEGNLLEMLTIILQQVSLSFNSLSSSIGYCKKLQHYENTNNTLTEELKTEITNNKTLKMEVVKLQQENDLLRKSLKQENLKENTETSDMNIPITSDTKDVSMTSDTNDVSITLDTKNNPVTSIIMTNSHTCYKCFSNSSNLKRHQKICKNVRNPLQCKICLKIFSSPQSKYNHKKKVNCSPPPIKQPQTAFIINNNNNIDMITPMQ